MVRGVGFTKDKKKKEGLTKDKDYITEAYLQGGKAVGKMTKKLLTGEKRKNNTIVLKY